ncbi:hypothetical protein EDM52_08665 [Brevibacillus invocatus]|uniref:Uncharacterized protein n=1 Tax=Brevibacillus invocatus TaxID=173959 RepID=A0A3M8CGZ5_9BACL|nr:hypothetical protein EDM52_08665 [Brevibacillus invocatus]
MKLSFVIDYELIILDLLPVFYPKFIISIQNRAGKNNAICSGQNGGGFLFFIYYLERESITCRKNRSCGLPFVLLERPYLSKALIGQHFTLPILLLGLNKGSTDRE